MTEDNFSTSCFTSRYVTTQLNYVTTQLKSKALTDMLTFTEQILRAILMWFILKCYASKNLQYLKGVKAVLMLQV